MKRILDLIFPNLCLHCFAKAPKGYFCKSCSGLFELKLNPSSARTISALEDQGPVLSLIRNMENGRLPKLYQGAASFLIYVITKQNWPLPDIITSVPKDPFSEAKADAAYFVAKEIASFLKRPYKRTLRNLKSEERSLEFKLKKPLKRGLLIAIDKKSQEAGALALKAEELFAISLI